MKIRVGAALSIALVVAGCASGSTPGWTFGPVSSPAIAGSPLPDAPASSSIPSASEPSTTPAAVGASPSPAASSARPNVATVDPRARGLEVGFGEWAVVPEASVIRPGDVTFVVRNGGSLTHGFEVEREGANGEDEFEVEGPEFGAGETVRISATLPPGTYEVYCYIGDHEDRGMVTRLVVREDAPLQTEVPSSPPAGQVAISGFAFTPPVVRLATGTEVTWQNQDPAEHTVTADGGAFGSDALRQNQRFSARFTTRGSFTYFCAIHPAMRGTVEVT